MPTAGPERWAGLLLAAGLSTRMGESKARLLWKGRTALESQLRALAEAGAGEIVAVVAPHDIDEVARWAAECAPARVVAVANSTPELGKTLSLQMGLAAISVGEAILVLAVDQPRNSSLLERLVARHFRAGRAITLPVYRGRGGHPVVFASKLRGELAATSEASQGLRSVVRADPTRVERWEADDASVLLDLNNPKDYVDLRPDEGAGQENP